MADQEGQRVRMTVTIPKDGGPPVIEYEGHGFKGPECQRVIDVIAGSGPVKSSVHKPEFNEQETEAQQQVTA